MTREPSQLVFDWGQRSALGAEDFLLSPANAAAVALVDRWPDWPGAVALVVGPEKCGKSHLANVWRLRSGAAMIAAAEIGEAAIALLIGQRALVVEDIDRGIASEALLFHLINAARESRATMLFTSRQAPGNLAITLPDLRSRLRALPVTSIGAPDEALLKALIVKLLADRQLTASPAVVHAIVRNMDRSMAAAVRIVDALDRQSLATGRPINRALAREVLGLHSGAAEDDRSVEGGEN